MNGGHDAGDDGEGLVQGVGHGGQAVGGAGSSGDDLIVSGQGLLVDGVDDGLQVVAGGSRDDDLAGASLNVSLGLSLAGVEAGALQNDVDAQLAPGAILSILNGVEDVYKRQAPSARTSWQKWASHSKRFRAILADCKGVFAIWN